MPGPKHEAIVHVINNEPQLVGMLLRRLGVGLPADATAVMADTNLSVRDPDQDQELIADTVIIFEGPDAKVAVIAEVQKILRVAHGSSRGPPTRVSRGTGTSVTWLCW